MIENALTVDDDDFPLLAGKDGARLRSLYDAAPDSLSFRKLRKRLLRQTRDAISRFGMTSARRWLVCLSGGKDSYTLLALLLDLKAQGALPADLVACNLDQGQPGFPVDVLPRYLSRLGVRSRIERRDTYSVVTAKIPAGKTYCSLCSRLRRGHLYRIAREEGCDAIALGHHRDDALETFLMNLMNGGRLAAMPPKLLNDEGDLLTLRPLIDCAEGDIARFAEAMRFPIIPCTLCGSQDGLERERMREMLDGLERERPEIRATMWAALQNVGASHLADPALFDFSALEARKRSG
jgi:tRNA 2-thiocytidine biosynthesis protein TtcA